MTAAPRPEDWGRGCLHMRLLRLGAGRRILLACVGQHTVEVVGGKLEAGEVEEGEQRLPPLLLGGAKQALLEAAEGGVVQGRVLIHDDRRREWLRVSDLLHLFEAAGLPTFVPLKANAGDRQGLD